MLQLLLTRATEADAPARERQPDLVQLGLRHSAWSLEGFSFRVRNLGSGHASHSPPYRMSTQTTRHHLLSKYLCRLYGYNYM